MDESQVPNMVHRALDNCNAEFSDNDANFVKRVYKDGLEKYIARLQSLDFQSFDNVLDAGCGFGQWTLALSQMNHSIVGCDISQPRLSFLEDVCSQLDISNITTQKCAIDELPFSDNHFDAVFCYSVIQNTPWKKSLQELARVLKPSGTLYINANDLGWYLNLWQNEVNRTLDYDPKAVAAQAFTDTLAYQREGVFTPGASLIMDADAVRAMLQELDFSEVHIGDEGTLSFADSLVGTPMLMGEYRGFKAVFEVLAKKNARLNNESH